MKLPTLYQLTDEYLVAFQQLQESEMPPEVIRDTLEGLSGDFESKATAIVQMARNNESLAEQIDAAIKAMQERAAVLKRHAERLNDYVLENLERTGIKKIECPYFKISIAQNPPKLEIDEGALVPSEYMTIPKIPDPQPDKKAIKAALEAGKSIPGCHLKRGTRLVVK